MRRSSLLTYSHIFATFSSQSDLVNIGMLDGHLRRVEKDLEKLRLDWFKDAVSSRSTQRPGPGPLLR